MRRPALSLRSKMLVAFLGLGLLPVLVLAVVNHVVARNQLLTLAKRTSVAEMEMASDNLEQRLEAVGADAAFLAQSAGESTDAGTLERTFIDVARRHPEFQQLRYLDVEGMEQLRVERPSGGDVVVATALQDKRGRYYYKQGLRLRPGAFYFSPLDANIEHGFIEDPPRFVFRVVTPVHRGEERVGIVVVNVGADVVFAPLRNLRASREVELWVFGADGAALGEVGPLDDRLYVTEDAQGFRATLPEERAVVEQVGDRLVTTSELQLPKKWFGDPWTITMSQPAGLIVADVERLSRQMAALVVLFAGLCVLAAVVAARTLANPLEELAGWSRRIAEGDHDPDFRVETGDEIEALGDALRETTGALASAQALLEADNAELREALQREMAHKERLLYERMAMERQILHADRLASLGLLATSLAHEIGNPLAGVRTNLDLAAGRVEPGTAAHRAIGRAAAEISRLGEILKRVTGFATGRRGDHRSQRPVEVVVDVWQLVASRARALGTALEVSGSAADCAVQMDVVAFRQICLNLLLNSLQTEPPPTRIIIGSNRVEDVLEIRFEDDGPGFRPEALERGFEPLFTTRAEGTGLGLAIVSRLAAAHGAEAVLGEGRHGGAAVTLRWPIDAERRAVS